MSRYLLPFFLLAALLYGGAEPRTERAKITRVTGQTALIDRGGIPKGISGIVLHHYDQTHAAIVASAVVTHSGPDTSELKLLPYQSLHQPNLPTVKTPPQQGDTVILGYLYDRVLPIVPNQQSLEEAHRRFPKLRIIHPDLVAAELAKEKEPLPHRPILQRTCEKFHLGLVMIMFSDGTDFLDCVSWQKVGHADVKAVDPKDFKEPFYNRFKSIPTAFYDFGEYHIADYDRYYHALEKEE